MEILGHNSNYKRVTSRWDNLATRLFFEAREGSNDNVISLSSPLAHTNNIQTTRSNRKSTMFHADHIFLQMSDPSDPDSEEEAWVKNAKKRKRGEKTEETKESGGRIHKGMGKGEL